MRALAFSAVLFLSGASALVFQTLWLRLSGLVFGNSVWSAALILSSFMTGLAIGSGIAARIRKHRFRPLHFYIALEIAIALSGCLIVLGLPLAGKWLAPVFQSLWAHDAILNLLRFMLSFVVLLVPTTAMGLTLPMLLQDEVLKRYDFGQVTGLLYGANTVGAVLGAIAGEAYLVRAFGIEGTGLAAGALNCAAALGALALIKLDTVSITFEPEIRWRIPHLTELPYRPLIISFGSGAILLCLEVVWFRFLRLYTESSSTAFAIMLAIVLAGIGVGGLTSALMRRYAVQAKSLIPILLLLAAILTLVCYVFFPLPKLADRFENYFFQSWWEIAGPSLFLMFPTAFLSGILFPQIVTVIQKTQESRINSVGIATLANTIGAAIGPLVAGFILLPRIGFQASLLGCAVAYALLAFIQVESPTWSPRTGSGKLLIGLTIGLGAILVFFPRQRDEQHFANARRAFEAVGEHLVKRIEGNADTYQLLRCDIYGEPYYYRLAANAFSLANTESRNQRYMRLFAYLPLFFRPESRDALLICYGCGVTADALAHFHEFRTIDIVDISKEVFALASYYEGTNRPNALSDSRVHTFVQDGRFYLQATPRQYDVITGEPPPPKVAGVVNLYTQEFFGLMSNRLRENGVASFWLPISQLKVDETKSILRAFRNVFPTVSVWASGDDEWIMVGIKGKGRPLTEDEARRLWQDPSTGSDLKRVGIERPEQLGSLFLMDGEQIDRVTSESKPLTDSYPKRLTDDPPDQEEVRKFAWNYVEAQSASKAFHTSQLVRSLLPPTIRRIDESSFIVREARYLSEIVAHGSNKLAELDVYLRHSKLRYPVLEAMHTDEFRVALAKQKSPDAVSPPPEFSRDFVADALADRNFARATQLLESKREQGLAERNDIFLLIYLDCLTGKTDAAESLAANIGVSRHDDWFVDWLWGKLQAEFGFRPPA